MCKKISKFYTHLMKLAYSKPLYFLLFIGSIVGICVGLIFVAKLIAFFLIKTSYFSSYSMDNLTSGIFGSLLVLFIMVCLACAMCGAIEDKKTRRRLANRQLPEYVMKYSKYVALVENSLKTEKYKTVSLSNKWVKLFDEHLSNTSSVCSRTRGFTDFEVAACLIYALDSYGVSIDFAFHCAKLVITKPNIYHRKYLDGEELCLEASETMEEVCFSSLDENVLSFILSLLKAYLTQRDSYDEVLKLADFLRILYLSCKQ